MKHAARAAALALAVTWPCAALTPSLAQGHLYPNPFVVSDETYRKPSGKYLPIYDNLRQRRVIEELRDFLRPLRLPRQIKVVISECSGAQTVPYKSGGSVTICYEMVDRIKQMAAEMYPNDPAHQEQVVVAGFIQAVLHETAHAVFDILDVPIWGREADAADRLAALVMMEFGEDLAKKVMSNTVRLFEHSAKQGAVWTGSDFASTRSPDARRYFNYACIAVGADYMNFGGWVERLVKDKGWTIIPEIRSGRCGHIMFGGALAIVTREYDSILKAFNLRIMPHVDPDALVEVRATPWLSWSPQK